MRVKTTPGVTPTEGDNVSRFFRVRLGFKATPVGTSFEFGFVRRESEDPPLALRANVGLRRRLARVQGRCAREIIALSEDCACC